VAFCRSDDDDDDDGDILLNKMCSSRFYAVRSEIAASASVRVGLAPRMHVYRPKL